MKVAAVIVTYNNAPMLSDLLRDLEGQTRRPDDVIVIDNASRDGTSEMVRRDFPGVTCVRREGNEGSAGGFHEGLRIASVRNDAVLTLDDDVRLPKDSLAEALGGLAELDRGGHGAVGAVRSVSPDHPCCVPTRLELFPWRGTLIKSSVIRDIGLPRKDYFIYGEDIEYALRFAARGYSCFWIPRSVHLETRKEGRQSLTLLHGSITLYRDAFRLYYAFRNWVSIDLEYRRWLPLLRLLGYGAKAILFLFFSGSGRAGKIRAILRGLADGFRRRLGKHTAYLPEGSPGEAGRIGATG